MAEDDGPHIYINGYSATHLLLQSEVIKKFAESFGFNFTLFTNYADDTYSLDTIHLPMNSLLHSLLTSLVAAYNCNVAIEVNERVGSWVFWLASISVILSLRQGIDNAHMSEINREELFYPFMKPLSRFIYTLRNKLPVLTEQEQLDLENRILTLSMFRFMNPENVPSYHTPISAIKWPHFNTEPSSTCLRCMKQ